MMTKMGTKCLFIVKKTKAFGVGIAWPKLGLTVNALNSIRYVTNRNDEENSHKLECFKSETDKNGFMC